jgi:hypothetical protein
MRKERSSTFLHEPGDGYSLPPRGRRQTAVGAPSSLVIFQRVTPLPDPGRQVQQPAVRRRQPGGTGTRSGPRCSAPTIRTPTPQGAPGANGAGSHRSCGNDESRVLEPACFPTNPLGYERGIPAITPIFTGSAGGVSDTRYRVRNDVVRSDPTVCYSLACVSGGMIARPRVLPNPLDLVEVIIRWPPLAVADRARDAGPCPVQELPSSHTGSPKNLRASGPTTPKHFWEVLSIDRNLRIAARPCVSALVDRWIASCDGADYVPSACRRNIDGH